MAEINKINFNQITRLPNAESRRIARGLKHDEVCFTGDQPQQKSKSGFLAKCVAAGIIVCAALYMLIKLPFKGIAALGRKVINPLKEKMAKMAAQREEMFLKAVAEKYKELGFGAKTIEKLLGKSASVCNGNFATFVKSNFTDEAEKKAILDIIETFAEDIAAGCKGSQEIANPLDALHILITNKEFTKKLPKLVEGLKFSEEGVMPGLVEMFHNKPELFERFLNLDPALRNAENLKKLRKILPMPVSDYENGFRAVFKEHKIECDEATLRKIAFPEPDFYAKDVMRHDSEAMAESARRVQLEEIKKLLSKPNVDGTGKKAVSKTREEAISEVKDGLAKAIASKADELAESAYKQRIEGFFAGLIKQ